MRYSTPETRTVQWGHNGITFIDWKEIIAVVDFPCGPQGPVDGSVGSKERKRWLEVCESWREHEMLPVGAYFPPALKRGDLSRRFLLPIVERPHHCIRTAELNACVTCGSPVSR